MEKNPQNERFKAVGTQLSNEGTNATWRDVDWLTEKRSYNELMEMVGNLSAGGGRKQKGGGSKHPLVSDSDNITDANDIIFPSQNLYKEVQNC